MARSKSSNKWLKEHFEDVFVKQSREEGYRSRAAYKLLEIQNKDHLFKPGMSVIDLGAAPGSWSQIVVKLVKDHGQVIALDVLPMDPIIGVEFVQGDFTDHEVFDKLLNLLNHKKVDAVISDMAPNMSGNKHVDIPRSMYLIELALDLAKQVLKPGGCLLVKIFHGSGFEQVLREMRNSFEKVIIRKPAASRNRSKECYLLAKNYKL